MPAPTPGYVKNMIRRSLREIVDKSPNKKDEKKIWEFFNYECAYCGKTLSKEHKESHIDHLISSSLGGSNHISNRVLSCADCNEKEKLDKPWKSFLLQKNSNNNVAQRRKGKILEWQKKHSRQIMRIDGKIIGTIGRMGSEVIKIYDQKVEEIRKLKTSRK